MKAEDILKYPSGMYTARTEDGQEVVILREEGHGYTVKLLNSKGIFECEDFDENGCPESSYVEQ